MRCWRSRKAIAREKKKLEQDQQIAQKEESWRKKTTRETLEKCTIRGD